jgi:hypothetical protein
MAYALKSAEGTTVVSMAECTLFRVEFRLGIDHFTTELSIEMKTPSLLFGESHQQSQSRFVHYWS